MAKKKDQKLKITGITNLPADYNGEPCVIMMEIVDVKGDRYESEIHMDNGFTENNLLEASKVSFDMCDALPERVHIRSVKVKK